MEYFNPQPILTPRVLATDLDGTLIPLPGSDANREDLRQLAKARSEGKLPLVFATGRNLESVEEAITEFDLPQPDWIICDVGSRIVDCRGGTGEDFVAYSEHLLELSGGLSRSEVEKALGAIDGLKLQVPEHQTDFKVSYECAAEQLDEILKHVEVCVADLPYSCMGSLDPFLNCGLIDVMPGRVNKAYALLWLATHADFKPDEVVYSGDSGNDLAALASGFHAIIVSNASTGLVGKVAALQSERGISHERRFEAKGKATSGVLEGCLHYGLISRD